MPDIVILVDHRSDFKWDTLGRRVLTTREYIAHPIEFPSKTVKILNLSRSYAYLGYGYYCSLLAGARRHKVIPSASTIIDLGQRGRYRSAIQDLEKTLQKTIRKMAEPPVSPFVVHVFFGRTDDQRFAKFARKAFDYFRCPILRAKVYWDGDWYIRSVRPLAITDLTEGQSALFGHALDEYTKVDWRTPKAPSVPRYSLAILHNPKEALPPSNLRALEKFVRIGESMGLAVELIQKKDFARLAEYDALFIRETTAIDHHTYRFAKKAYDEGMPVIDDPLSILRCTNKVYLAELLAAHKIPTPKTVVLDRRRLRHVEQELAYPMVLKVPDGAFSRGIVKVENRAELWAAARELFDESDIILAQEFMYTAFDWRVGILNRKPIFVCQYLMAKKHWQIVKYSAGGSFKEGAYKTFLVEDAPEDVVKLAVKAADLIGDGLYGVDIKQNDRGVFVVEINDNPNIETGCEDALLKDNLYRLILEDFLRRIERQPKTNGVEKPAQVVPMVPARPPVLTLVHRSS